MKFELEVVKFNVADVVTTSGSDCPQEAIDLGYIM